MSLRPAHTFPFTAIVGQETLKLALLLNAVDPLVGGVLVRGEKGTAKSTAVRALGAVLPEIDVVEECRFSCDPADPGSWCTECRERREAGPLPKSTRPASLVDLPVSATEDRLVGTLDLEHALKHGQRRFESGLLADAHRGILYVDEVNLLDDHLVDTLLDASAMGVNTVQREGVSFAHPARFILVGTMNPEEGDVRPQLLDRFGLCVDVIGERDSQVRVDIVKRRRAFDEDATAYCREWIDAEDELKVRLKHSRLRLSSVEMDDDILESIALLCIKLGVDGHRADLTLARAAAAFAALDARSEATREDVRKIAPLVLAHRMRRTPFQEEEFGASQLERVLAEAFSSANSDEQEGTPPGTTPGESESSKEGAAELYPRPNDGGSDDDFEGSPEEVLVAALDQARRNINGRRQETVSSDHRGRYSRSEPARSSIAAGEVALDATISAAAPHQSIREGDMAINVRTADVHKKIRTRKVGATVLFCVDASGSMGADSRMDAAKEAIVELLRDAYQKRDRVGLVSFRGDDAQVILSPTASVELAQLKLRTLPTGGATPMAAGLVKALEALEAEMRRNSDVVPWLVLVTDGRANVGLGGGLGSEDARAVAARVRTSPIHTVVIDSGSGPRSMSAAKEIAQVAGAEYVRLGSLDGQSIAGMVREHVGA